MAKSSIKKPFTLELFLRTIQLDIAVFYIILVLIHKIINIGTIDKNFTVFSKKIKHLNGSKAFSKPSVIKWGEVIIMIMRRYPIEMDT